MKIKRSELKQLALKNIGSDSLESQNQILLKICTARCARLSYMTFDNEIDYQKDIELHDRLLAEKHFSTFEHCARAMSDEEYHSFRKGKHEIELIDNTENHYWFIEDDSGEEGYCNNFKGFTQYRYLIENNEK